MSLSRPAPHHPIPLAGKIFRTLFLAIFFGLGLFFIGLIGQEVWETVQTHTWPRHPCVITRSEVLNQPSKNRAEPYVFQIEYRYSLNGQTHTSDRYRSKAERSSKWAKMEALTQRYPVGSSTTCLVNPSDPNQAVLAPNSAWIACFIIIPLIFVVIGAGGIWGLWRTPPPPVSTRPLSENVARPSGTGFLIFFFGIFFLAGTGGLVAMSGGLADFFRAKSWIATPCTVESSRVLTHPGKNGSTHSVDILYRYSFQNQVYRSNRYSFMGGSSSGYQAKSDVVKKFPPGRKTTCFVDPLDPTKAVLDRGWSWENLIILVPLLFAGIGAGGLFYAFRAKTKTSSPAPAWNVSAPFTPIAPGFGPITSTAAAGQPVVLQPKISALGKAIGMLVGALFWNGIVAFFVYDVFSSWNRGQPDWFQTLFMIPFVLVGLGLFAGVFYFLLAMANPIAKLALNSSSIPLGEKLHLGWGFEGKTERIQSLRITLAAREEATCRRGTRSCTDRNTFYRQDLIHITDPRQIVQGMAEAELPRDLMHSFSSGNNKIVWTLTLHGSIARWPDVKEEFELNVLPAQVIS